MESRFTELSSTDLSDSVFFEEVFLSYIKYLYPDPKKCIDDLSQIRTRYNEKDQHTQYHLRDQIESVLYRYHQMERDNVIAEKLEMKKRIAQLEEKMEKILKGNI